MAESGVTLSTHDSALPADYPISGADVVVRRRRFRGRDEQRHYSSSGAVEITELVKDKGQLFTDPRQSAALSRTPEPAGDLPAQRNDLGLASTLFAERGTSSTGARHRRLVTCFQAREVGLGSCRSEQPNAAAPGACLVASLLPRASSPIHEMVSGPFVARFRSLAAAEMNEVVVSSCNRQHLNYS
jgi:hypothetical protein